MDDAQTDKLVFGFLEAISAKSDCTGLSETEKVICLVYDLECEVANGGLDQFFINPAGDRWADTLLALKRINAARLTEIFAKALAVFPKGEPSADQLERARQLAEAGEPATKQLETLTDEYYGLYKCHREQDSYFRMAAFLIEQGLG